MPALRRLRKGSSAVVKRARQPLGTVLAVVMLFLAACNGSSTHHASYPEVNATPPPGLSGPALLAWHVLHDARPVADPVALATSLRHLPGPISRVARTTPLNESLNAEDQFWIAPDQQITAKLVYITPHVYDYVEDGAQVDLGALRSSADRFETSLYVADRRFFGSEWTPGVDGDPHITILNAPDLPGDLNGYFSPMDEYVTAVYPWSNEREMISMHIGYENFAPNTDEYDQTLAHEFERMIEWHLRPADPAWMREGMALLAQHINGFDVSDTDTAFFAKPGVQLDTWDAKEADPAQYGAAFLFLDYLAEHYGGYGILNDLMSDPAQAPLNINDVLAQNGAKDRFDDVFAKWIMANALNDVPQSDSSPYAYKTVSNEHATPQHSVTTLPFHDQSSAAPQYAAQYYDYTPAAGTDKTLHIAFAGLPAVPLISASTPPGDGTFWWSNRGDGMDSTLTRAFDLTSLAPGTTATLSFSLWYNLEETFDYGYVEVSTDDGHTWTTLPVTGGQAANPNGLNAGNGITGSSDGWVPESVDLSAYDGKSLQVRFETITDSSVNGEGMAIADIALPQISYQDSSTDQANWHTGGWVRGNGTLPETFIVEAATFASDGSLGAVQRMAINTNGDGTLDFPHTGTKVSRVLLAVAPIAPATTEPAQYTLDLTAQ
jgi:immune inhibitor A